VVSHDEAFVNRLLTGAANGIPTDLRAADAIDGQLWVLSRRKLTRYDGSFGDYKQKILRKLNAEDYSW
jgi:hypothetical protein